MSNTLYVIKKTSCRGDEWEDKFKVNKEELVRLFLKAINIEDEDDRYEFVEDLEVNDLQEVLGDLISTIFTCCDEQESREELAKRYKMLLSGEGSVELEESIIGFGLSPKQAILQLVGIDEEW